MRTHFKFRTSGARGRWRAAVAAAGLVAASAMGATAQDWNWPWEQQRPSKPAPREPDYRPAPRDESPPPGAGGAWSSGRGSICLQLEQRLVQENQRGSRQRDLLPQIEADIRQADRLYQTSEAQLERKDCYEFFLFSKTLRRTRQCVDLANQSEDARRRLGDLQAQRQDILSSSGQSYQDEIIRELARNNCGGNYAQEARKRDRGSDASIWNDEESGQGGWQNQYGALPYSTYRTLCVRLCDGYYFPVSFSTVPNHFEQDEEACQSKCATPAELYYHQNPGGSMDQAVAFKSQELYTNLQTAFKYRKEYIRGCSCKEAEATGPESAPAPEKGSPAAPGGPGRSAEAAPAAAGR